MPKDRVSGRINKDANRLALEKSPYLLQHAHNPVDWYPWGKEALDHARDEDKPIFLSIGYSTCHWCHVMEKESFEDPDVAQLMNSAFINIKVDREERPDIDSVYMKVSQKLAGRGGWPLNVILTPEQRPFFAATYIPKGPGLGGSGMLDLIPRMRQLWVEQREEVEYLASQIAAAIRDQTVPGSSALLNEKILESGYLDLLERFDDENGGFGYAPKFPTPHYMAFLLRYWKRSKEKKALAMVERSLQGMRKGGIYDHLGFGFHRYSTDAEWLVPHFEKMLYDQALLSIAYTEAYQATNVAQYRRTAEEIFTYVLRDMTSAQGGFYTAEDADSEGEEGRFYLWSFKQIEDVLTEEENKFVAGFLNLENTGNFEEEASGRRTGTNILHEKRNLSELASDLGLSERKVQSKWDAIRIKLLAERNSRVRPFKDNKILTDWNGLMIAALAKAGRAFGSSQYIKAAEKAAEFVLSNLLSREGRLFHRHCGGEVAVSGFLDDYAFFLWALIELYEATFQVGYLQSAVYLCENMIKYFWDEQNSGFYFTAADAEVLLIRPKDAYDGAIPSGNSVAMLDLLRLGHLTGNGSFIEKALQTGNHFASEVARSPVPFTQMLIAADYAIGPAFEVVITGNRDDSRLQEMLDGLRQVFSPRTMVILRLDKDESGAIVRIAPFTEALAGQKGRITAHVCSNLGCEISTVEARELQDMIREKG